MYKLLLQIQDYQQEIQLQQQYQKPQSNETDIQLQCQEILNELIPQYSSKISKQKSIDHWMNYRAFMNQIEPTECNELCNNEELMNKINQMLNSLNRPIYDYHSIPTLKDQQNEILFGEKMSVWKGDITTLQIDAIVNAANDQLLGCFRPHHHCIDNCIHTFAGPQLRRDCWKIMSKQQFNEPTGCAKITKAYNLPSKYVVHTVGPIVEDELTVSHINLLQACYINCLNVTDTLHLESIAFCGISTGVFGFPPSVASSVAIQTVIQWLYDNPHTSIKRIVFNVFSDNDQQCYDKSIDFISKKLNSSTIELPMNPNHSIIRNPNEIEEIDMKRISQFFKEADGIVIGAAAGLSADCGLDFSSTKFFNRFGYPLYSKGIQALYQTIGFEDYENENQQWGFFAVFADFMRFKQISDNQFLHYQKLLQILQHHQKEYFIKTTNVDGMFERSGYDMERFFNPQGDFKYIQCATPCTDDVYEFEPIMKNILNHLNPSTFEIPDEYIPKCPKCGGKMTQNLRGDDLFVESIHMKNQEKFNTFISDHIENDKKLLLIEIGVGMNTPVHIRYPFEHFTKISKNVLLVRVNIDRQLLVSDVPSSQYISLFVSANQFIDWLYNSLM